MIRSPLSRRAFLGAAALLVSLQHSALALPADPIFAAIRRAEAADAAYLRSGHLARTICEAGGQPPSEWWAYRAHLHQGRYLARRGLHDLTPATPEAAEALVAYYTSRVSRADDPRAAKAACKRLTKVFSRLGACRPP